MANSFKIILITIFLSLLSSGAIARVEPSNNNNNDFFIQYTNINNFKRHTTTLTLQKDGNYTIKKTLHQKELANREIVEHGKLSDETIYPMLKLIQDCSFFELNNRNLKPTNATDQSQIKLTISIDKKSNTLNFENGSILGLEVLNELTYLINDIIWSDKFSIERERMKQ